VYICINHAAVKFSILFTLSLVLTFSAHAQPCTTLGQNPSTAFPVCGTSVFSQSIVPNCGGKGLLSKCADSPYPDFNPFWYKFTCYQPGTLGFKITPIDFNDDYDWQIFDITGHDPNDVYTDSSLFVACDWSGSPGPTGASVAGKSLVYCYGIGVPVFSQMPVLKLNHTYLLLVSHFNVFRPSDKGYQLSFGGGTASITDTLMPALQSVVVSCDVTKVYIKTNKKIKCSSLAADGSDFSISPAAAKITSAKSFCDAFDMDSLELDLSNPLPAGNYTIAIQNGADKNTLLDNCDRNIPSGDSLSLKILPPVPTPMDSLITPDCAPQSLQLVFKNNILCSSVASDGSDFSVSGPSSVTVVSATTNCINQETKIITINLARSIVNGGIYQITLEKGDDGNTIVDECSQETPEGSSITFTVKDTVSAEFTYVVDYGCSYDTVRFQNEGKNGINKWFWQIDENDTSSLKNPVAFFTPFGSKNIKLEVSNGFCYDTTSKSIDFGPELKAGFEASQMICPEDSALFLNKSTGNIISYYWNFQNGNTSEIKDPYPQKYPILLAEYSYPVSLVVQNDLGCFDTAVNEIRVLKSCYIAVPNAFTPNGDGLNDFLYPLNAFKADNLDFKVYNRLGQKVFESHDWTQKWDGTVKGEPQDAGTYVWILEYDLHDTGKHVFMKGSSVLIR
jgi:gliding motility-associated-like protein